MEHLKFQFLLDPQMYLISLNSFYGNFQQANEILSLVSVHIKMKYKKAVKCDNMVDSTLNLFPFHLNDKKFRLKTKHRLVD